jgi:RecA-family ATPase
LSSTYRVLSAEDIKAFPPPTWLAHQIIPDGALAVLYGPPGVGKSFVAMDLAQSVGAGLRWMGRRTRQGAAVYVAAGEGVSGLGARIEGWESQRGLAVEDVHYLTEAVQLHQSASVNKFLNTIRQLDPVVVIIDTLARCFVGGDENSVQDMGQAISAADEIRDRTGAAVVFVHHTGRPDENNHVHERGSTGLKSAADTMIEMLGDEDSDTRELRCRKQKDSAKFPPITVQKHVILRRGKVLSIDFQV